MAIGSPGVVGADGSTGQIDQSMFDARMFASQDTQNKNPQTARAANAAGPQSMSGQGAQFIYVAATVANILCDNLSQTQINLLANFLSVVTTCVYAILTVENPTEILES